MRKILRACCPCAIAGFAISATAVEVHQCSAARTLSELYTPDSFERSVRVVPDDQGFACHFLIDEHLHPSNLSRRECRAVTTLATISYPVNLILAQISDRESQECIWGVNGARKSLAASDSVFRSLAGIERAVHTLSSVEGEEPNNLYFYKAGEISGLPVKDDTGTDIGIVHSIVNDGRDNPHIAIATTPGKKLDEGSQIVALDKITTDPYRGVELNHLQLQKQAYSLVWNEDKFRPLALDDKLYDLLAEEERTSLDSVARILDGMSSIIPPDRERKSFTGVPKEQLTEEERNALSSCILSFYQEASVRVHSDRVLCVPMDEDRTLEVAMKLETYDLRLIIPRSLTDPRLTDDGH